MSNFVAKRSYLGKTGSPEHYSWRNMRTRCSNPNFKQFASYGGRGIRVCERWNISFAAFLEDMGPRPAGTTLDRIDNNGHYEPGNCRWSTRKEQQRNTKKTTFVTFRGETRPVREWAEIIGMTYSRIKWRLRKGYPLEKVFTQQRFK